MESPIVVCGVPFRQKPRNGQVRVFEALDSDRRLLNVQLPTGYGKTFTAAGCFSILRHRGLVNALLWIVPSNAQLAQLEQDGPREFELTGTRGPLQVDDVSFFGAACLRRYLRNERQVFAITIQSLIESRGMNNVGELMSKGRWMVVVDEQHHHGDEKAWGKAALSLPAQFVLAMSATPFRSTVDNAFGTPHVQVTYRQAFEEGAVKPLTGHAYHYRLDAVTPEGEIVSYTTADLVAAVGSDSAESIEKFKLERKMRWSPKYVSPLITTPIGRMFHDRLVTNRKLQAIVRAMCVSHAQIVCDQIRTWVPGIEVDWVGTGPDGRDDKTNREIIARFCPQKNERGEREAKLDVLVCVGMAGEGLDAVNVSEIIHLHRASKNNTNDQVNGRASRYLADAHGNAVEGNINFDACSDYARFTGDRIMDAMDGDEIDESVSPEPRRAHEDDGKWPIAPQEPPIEIADLTLEFIDSGNLEKTGEALMTIAPGVFSRAEIQEAIARREGPVLDLLVNAYRGIHEVGNKQFNEKAVVSQWKEHVNNLLRDVTRRVIALTHKSGIAKNESLAGDIKHLINARKFKALGPVTNDLQGLKAHYEFLRNLDAEIVERGVPQWLALS